MLDASRNALEDDLHMRSAHADHKHKHFVEISWNVALLWGLNLHVEGKLCLPRASLCRGLSR